MPLLSRTCRQLSVAFWNLLVLFNAFLFWIVLLMVRILPPSCPFGKAFFKIF